MEFSNLLFMVDGQVGDSIYAGGPKSMLGIKEYLSGQYNRGCPYVRGTVGEAKWMIESYLKRTGSGLNDVIVSDGNVSRDLAECSLALFMALQEGQWTRNRWPHNESQQMNWVYHPNGEVPLTLSIHGLGERAFSYSKHSFDQIFTFFKGDMFMSPEDFIRYHFIPDNEAIVHGAG